MQPDGLALGSASCYTSSDGRVALYLGDCLELLPTLEGVEAIISDPPYGMNWNTDSTRFSGGRRSSLRGQGVDDYAPIHGDEMPFDPRPWLTYDKVVLFGSNHYSALLPVGTTLVWQKKHEHQFGSFLSDAEVAWMKGGHGVYCKRDTSHLALNGDGSPSRPCERIHPSQKPIPLMAWCMDKAKVPEGATVLDPYMGSGSTIIAAIRTGQKAIGIEKDPEHFKNAVERIKRELAQGDLFHGCNETSPSVDAKGKPMP